MKFSNTFCIDRFFSLKRKFYEKEIGNERERSSQNVMNKVYKTFTKKNSDYKEEQREM